MDEHDRSAKNRQSQKYRSKLGLEETSVTSTSLTDSNDSGRRGGGGGSGGLQALGKQRGDIERLPDPSLVDWEVAVVRASSSVDDMVRWTNARRGMWTVMRVPFSDRCSRVSTLQRSARVLYVKHVWDFCFPHEINLRRRRPFCCGRYVAVCEVTYLPF